MKLLDYANWKEETIEEPTRKLSTIITATKPLAVPKRTYKRMDITVVILILVAALAIGYGIGRYRSAYSAHLVTYCHVGTCVQVYQNDCTDYPVLPGKGPVTLDMDTLRTLTLYIIILSGGLLFASLVAWIWQTARARFVARE